jgi:hypothetical protein
VVCPSQPNQGGESISIADLSPHNIENAQEVFVLFKAYFDGANDPNNPQHRWVTLSCIFSDKDSLGRFSRAWKAVLSKHSVECLHTTDAVREGLHDLLWDCMRVVEEHAVGDTFHGIISSTVTIDAKEFERIRGEVLDGPQILSEVLASQGLDRIIMGVQAIARLREWDEKRVFYNLFFDRGEPYRGHLEDRMRNPNFRRTTLAVNEIDVERYIHIGPALDSRDFPELQAADLFAWCYNHRHRIRFEWQHRILDIRSDAVLIDKDALSKPNLTTVKYIHSLNLPRRSHKKKRPVTPPPA